MNVTYRQYSGYDDFIKVGEFLIKYYIDDNRDANWFQPTWEYMHYHPSLEEEHLHLIRIWEDDGEIVGVVHYESELLEVFIQIHPDYTYLREEMLIYAEEHLSGIHEERKCVAIYIHDNDENYKKLALSRGYEKTKYKRPMSKYVIPEVFPEITLPEGFVLQSLADENDLAKVHTVLWKGFNHEGEPPEKEISSRVKMQSAPNFREDITMVTVAPDGNYVSFCGMWYDDTNHIAYVEPVATDPKYRKMGLGKAAVLEGVRRCGELGATVAYVGSLLEFYLRIGFEKIYTGNAYLKYLD